MRLAALAVLAGALAMAYGLWLWLAPAGDSGPRPASPPEQGPVDDEQGGTDEDSARLAGREGPAPADSRTARPEGRDPGGQAPATLRPPLRSMAEIVARRGDELALSRLAALPRVLVFDFPSLAAQGRAFNRVAALIEKAGFPRARVVSQDRLAERVSQGGGSLETFYYGHNYDTDELARFFRLAQASEGGLSPPEARLRRLLLDTGALAAGERAPSPATGSSMSSLSRSSRPRRRRACAGRSCGTRWAMRSMTAGRPIARMSPPSGPRR